MIQQTFAVRDFSHARQALDYLAARCAPLTLVRNGARAIAYASPDAPNVAEFTIDAHPYADTSLIVRVDDDAAVLALALAGAVAAA